MVFYHRGYRLFFALAPNSAPCTLTGYPPETTTSFALPAGIDYACGLQVHPVTEPDVVPEPDILPN
jgi:hypothetical protein